MDWVLDDIRDTAVDSPRRSDDVAGWGVVGVVGVSVSGGGGGVVVVGVVNKQEIISVPETAILAASRQKAADMRAGNRPYRTVYSGVSVV